MPLEFQKFEKCPFCERVAGRAAWTVIAETETLIAWLNPRQFEKGQAIITPKRHATSILDLQDNETTAIYPFAKKIAQAQVDALNCDGVTIYQNNGWAAGQEVSHFHLHVVPRHDGGGTWGQGPPPIRVLENIEKMDDEAKAKITNRETLEETANILKQKL